MRISLPPVVSLASYERRRVHGAPPAIAFRNLLAVLSPVLTLVGQDLVSVVLAILALGLQLMLAAAGIILLGKGNSCTTHASHSRLPSRACSAP
jgi:hypothetical protein